jgi:hypothetical protein
MRAEFGSWVTSDTLTKRDGSPRKVWDATATDDLRLAVIRTDGARESHMLSLHVGTAEYANDALEALSLALDALGTLPAFVAPVAPAPAPAPVRKAPTPPVAPPVAAPAPKRATPAPAAPAPVVASPASIAATRTVTIGKARLASARVTQPAPVAQDADGGWFAALMADAQ